MPTTVHRSQRVEELVDALARTFVETASPDPFEAVPVVVGSRGMERWLRHELATRLGSATNLAFVFPRTAFDGAATWLLSRPSPLDRAAFWELDPSQRDPWSGPPLSARVLPLLRAHLQEPAFRRVRSYLGDLGEAVGVRELAFTREVGATLEKLLHDRAGDALRWTADPRSAPAEHVWLAELLRDLEPDATRPSPARRLAAVCDLPPAGMERPLFVFGLSTLQPGDKDRLDALARHLPVHLFMLAPSREWWQDVRRGVAREGTNSLLAANGEPSRDFQHWLEAREYREPAEPAASAAPETLLGTLQDWIDRAADDPRPEAAPWADREASSRSIDFHACHGALRQCEALRDELLRRFAADPSLEPRHVLVVTPDVTTYAPLIAATFARRSSETPAIPFHIADLGIRATNPVADALVRALDLVDGRVTASRLHDVLAVQPVRQRFRLRDEDLADVETMMIESGMRWGWDAADRERHGQPSLDQNTVRFALERLALGVLLPDPGELAVLPAVGASGLPAAVPLELSSRERVERFGRLVQACEALRSLHDRASAPATASAWRARLGEILDAITEVGDGTAWLRLQVDQRLEELLVDVGLPLDRTAVLSLLRGAFELPQHGDRPVTGAVTVCAMEPMRSVPFRIVAMLGLDDGVFPRDSRPAAWDPFAERRAGEHDRRTVDRHLFLEGLLCARDALLVFGTAFEGLRGERVPMSVVVRELAEVVGAGLGREADALFVEHPLQPWSERAFDDDRRRPFDGLWVEAASARLQDRPSGLRGTPHQGSFPPEDEESRTLRAEQLASALANPQKELLRKRLLLNLEREEDALEDREPIEPGALDEWAVRDRVLRAWQGDETAPLPALEARLRAEGLLPLSAAGRAVLARSVDEAARAMQAARAIPGGRGAPLQVACSLDRVRLEASVSDVRDEGARRRLVWLTASKSPNARQQLLSWITLLVATAGGCPVHAAHAVGFAGSTSLRAPGDAGEARRVLTALLDVRRQSRSGLVPLFPEVSRSVAETLRKAPDADPRELVLGVRAAWEGAYEVPGVRDRAWVTELFGSLSIEELAERAPEIVRVADLVWGPLLAAEELAAREGA